LRGSRSEHLAERMRLDLREFVFHVLKAIATFGVRSDPNMYNVGLTFGFMVLICSRDGVPKTLMISTNWSIPDSPGNNGWPNINSAITQPVDQISRRKKRFENLPTP
jgi:hypothetical protein